jgi:predicted nucleic acid-binding protein
MLVTPFDEGIATDVGGKLVASPTGCADASLVRMAERENIRRVFTLDRRDFATYLSGRGQGFTIIPDLT